MSTRSISIQRIMREKKKMELYPSDIFLALPFHQNIFEWHFLLFNFPNDSPFIGGQFHGIINIPGDYPLKPPSIKFVTPNGRFAVDEKICLSFTNYHPETWSSSWTIASMLVGLVSFMHTNEKTLGGLDCHNSQKQDYAKKSIEFNLNNPQFVELFAPHFHKLGIHQKKTQENQSQQSDVKENLLQQNKEIQVDLNVNEKNIKINMKDNINNDQFNINNQNYDQNNINIHNDDQNNIIINNNIDFQNNNNMIIDIDNNIKNNNDNNDNNKNVINNNNNNINIINNNDNDNENKINIINNNNNNNNNAARQTIILIVILLAILLLIFYIIFGLN